MMRRKTKMLSWVLIPTLAMLGGCSVAGDDGIDNGDLDNTNQNAGNANDNRDGPTNDNQNDNGQPPDNSNDNGTGNGNDNSDPGNTNANTNDNLNDNGNTNTNTNDNGNTNANDNVNGNTNDNTNDNGNDLCPGGFTLAIAVITSGAGAVSVDPPGGCFAAGTNVILSAVAEETYTFLAFSGDVSSESLDVVVTMDADKGIIATFTGNCFIASATTVLEFDAFTGEFVGEFVTPGAGGLSSSLGATFGPDGDLYVSASDGVRRFDGTTGAFVAQVVGPGDGGLSSTFGFDFGPGGDLFVADRDTVLEYDGATGAFVGEFVTAGDGGLEGATALHFGPSGNLFVVGTPDGGTAGAVFEYDGNSGAFIAEFVPTGNGGLGVSFDFTFGPGGDLFISTTIAGRVIRYGGATGEPQTCPCSCIVPCPSDLLPDANYVISSLTFPSGVAFAPNGNMLVTSGGDIREFAVPPAGPTEQTPFFAADPADPFAINIISFITFKPLP
ncbi:MAG: hypothetical protein O7D91_02290 [Planctomycetota bacterium]|nr:hypothetical protein [Planctomycetota bacterium]